MQDTAKTLTDADVELVVQAVVACAVQHGAHLRL